MDGHPQVDPDDENVLVVAGDVTSIGDSATTDDAVTAGGGLIAANLTPDGDVLNIAFVTGGGGVQIVELPIGGLVGPGGVVSAGDHFVDAQLTALSNDVISSGAGAATPMGTVAVAISLDEHGVLNLSFVDGEGQMQLVEANIADLVQSLEPGGDTTG